MSRNLWKTVSSEINITFLSFVSIIAHLFLNHSENVATGVAYKRFVCKKRANSNLIAGRTDFLPNQTMRLILELHV